MGQIIGGAAKPKRCNLNKLSQLGIPSAGEYILVSSDNSMNAAGQGNFDCYIVGNGRDAATALELKSLVDDGAFDISAYRATGNVLAKYADLAAALDGGNNIPEAFRKGGMSVKFVRSSDNKYVQWRYMGTDVTGTPNPFIDTANWEGVDDEPTYGSQNLVKSGSIFDKSCVYVPDLEISGTIINGIYPRQTNNYIMPSNTTNLIYYPVSAGITYLFKGIYQIITNLNGCGIAFTKNIPSSGASTTRVFTLSGNAFTIFNDTYTPEQNGYVSIAINNNSVNTIHVYTAKSISKADYYANVAMNGEAEKDYNSVYDGEIIRLPQKRENVCRIDKIFNVGPITRAYVPQGADIVNGVYYQFYYHSTNNSKCIGYDISVKEPSTVFEAELAFPEPYNKCHAGCICFTRKPSNNGSIPLVWIAGNEGNVPCAFLADINTGQMVVKKYFNLTVTLPFDLDGNPVEEPLVITDGMMCIDSEGKRGWGILRNSGGAGPIAVTPFTFDDTQDGDISSTIVQGEPYLLPSLGVATQDFIYIDNKVLIVAGNYGNQKNAKIAVLDVNEKRIVSVIDVGDKAEAQGISTWNGNIYCSMYTPGYGLYKISF